MDYRNRLMKLNEIDLNRLHVFRVITETGSLREAGEVLLRTPSAMSQSLATLESQLGIQLFVRSGIRMELTAAGHRLLGQVRQSETELNRVLEEIRGESAMVRGRVTLGMPPGYPAVSFADQLGAALWKYRELQLRYRFLIHSELAEGLKNHELNLALSLQPLRRWHRPIKSTEIRKETLVLAMPPRYRHVAAGAISELSVVDYYQKPTLIDGWLRHHRLGGVNTQIRVYGATLDHVLQMVHRGVGCAVVPRHTILADLASGELVEHTFDQRRPWHVGVWLNTLTTPNHLSPAVQKIYGAFK
jgi:DNA-binding transcriptional LysR family regulator